MAGFLNLVPVEVLHPSKRHRGRFPPNLARLHPIAAAMYQRIRDGVVIDGMFRTPEVSRWAVEQGRGAQSPAYSGHNFGLSIDVEVYPSMRLLKIKTKAGFDEWMESEGWYCHRTDHKRGPEDWHYNHLADPPRRGERFTSAALERQLVKLYGQFFKLSRTELQAGLKMLHFYGGEIDGKIGPRSKAAIKAFQAAWGLKVDGIPGKRTQRTLAYVAFGEHDMPAELS